MDIVALVALVALVVSLVEVLKLQEVLLTAVFYLTENPPA